MSKIAEDAKNFLRQWSALTAFATSAVEAGDIEEQTNNLKSEQEKLKKQNDDYKKENDDLISRGIDLKKEIEENKQKNIDTVNDAKDEAANILRKIEQEAVIKRQQTKDEIMSMKHQADEEQQAATNRINELQNNIDDLLKQKQILEDAIAALKSKFV